MTVDKKRELYTTRHTGFRRCVDNVDKKQVIVDNFNILYEIPKKLLTQYVLIKYFSTTIYIILHKKSLSIKIYYIIRVIFIKKTQKLWTKTVDNVDKWGLR